MRNHWSENTLFIARILIEEVNIKFLKLAYFRLTFAWLRSSFVEWRMSRSSKPSKQVDLRIWLNIACFRELCEFLIPSIIETQRFISNEFPLSIYRTLLWMCWASFTATCIHSWLLYEATGPQISVISPVKIPPPRTSSSLKKHVLKFKPKNW